MVWFLFDEFSIVIDQSTVSRLLATRKWSKKLPNAPQLSEVASPGWLDSRSAGVSGRQVLHASE
jgi:hypothetical protein